MKAMLKIILPVRQPGDAGTIASRIETAPRRPTHETNARLVAA